MEARVLVQKRLTNGTLIQIVHGDLTRERVDAIVDAANLDWHLWFPQAPWGPGHPVGRA